MRHTARWGLYLKVWVTGTAKEPDFALTQLVNFATLIVKL